MKDVNEFVWKAVRQLKDLGVTPGHISKIEVNNRVKSRWGQCSRRYDGTRYTYRIEINGVLLKDDVTYMATMDTVMHEVIHTCEGAFNHGKEFKRLAAMVNGAYGYRVQRCTSAEEKNIEPAAKKVKYLVKCEKCGHVYKYQRETKLIQILKSGRTTTRYACGVCRADNFTLEILG